MKETIKKYLMYKIPAWVSLSAVLAISFFIYYTYPKPPQKLIPLQLAGVERILDKQEGVGVSIKDVEAKEKYNDLCIFLNKYLYLSLLEYKDMFIISYGELEPETISLFDKTIKLVEERLKICQTSTSKKN